MNYHVCYGSGDNLRPNLAVVLLLLLLLLLLQLPAAACCCCLPSPLRLELP
jgi:hypothetical protein